MSLNGDTISTKYGEIHISEKQGVVTVDLGGIETMGQGLSVVYNGRTIELMESCVKVVHGIGDVLEDGWILAGYSKETGCAFSIEPPCVDTDENGLTWDEAVNRASVLKEAGYKNARLPSNDEWAEIRGGMSERFNRAALLGSVGLKSYWSRDEAAEDEASYRMIGLSTMYEARKSLKLGGRVIRDEASIILTR